MPQRRLPLDDQHGVVGRRRPSTDVDGRRRAWCEWAFSVLLIISITFLRQNSSKRLGCGREVGETRYRVAKRYVPR